MPAQTKTTKYEHVIPQLVAIDESKILACSLSSTPQILRQVAIAELIAGMRKTTVSLVPEAPFN